MTIRLHSRYQNSAGQRIRTILNLKGIEYDYVPIASISSPDYLAINPQGLMPALEIDGQIVAQSMAIAELLEELFPAPAMLPADVFERAQVRSFAHHICADLHPLNSKRVRAFLQNTLGADDGAVRQWYHHWVGKAFASLETQLRLRPKASTFCFGETPGLADVCLVPQMDNARRFDCDLSNYPLLVGIDARCRELDAIIKAAPDAQPDFPGIT